LRVSAEQGAGSLFCLSNKLLVIGDCNLDLIFGHLLGSPKVGADLLAGSFAQVPGGGPFISAVTIHRLGLSVAWAADFGNDEFSQWVLAKVREEGLPASFSCSTIGPCAE